MRGVRFTKAELAYLRDVLERQFATDKSSSLLAKLEAAEMPVKRAAAGVNVTDALAAFYGVLGRRLIKPPGSARGVFARMQRRLTALGLTAGDCRTVAKVAAVEWQGPIKAESLVNQADRLLAASQLEIDMRQSTPISQPVELGDEEL